MSTRRAARGRGTAGAARGRTGSAALARFRPTSHTGPPTPRSARAAARHPLPAPGPGSRPGRRPLRLLRGDRVTDGRGARLRDASESRAGASLAQRTVPRTRLGLSPPPSRFPRLSPAWFSDAGASSRSEAEEALAAGRRTAGSRAAATPARAPPRPRSTAIPEATGAVWSGQLVVTVESDRDEGGGPMAHAFLGQAAGRASRRFSA